MEETEAALARAHAHTRTWLASLRDRSVPPQASVDEVVARLGTDLPKDPTPAAEVVDLLAAACEPGLVAMPSGRFFGFVACVFVNAAPTSYHAIDSSKSTPVTAWDWVSE